MDTHAAGRAGATGGSIADGTAIDGGIDAAIDSGQGNAATIGHRNGRRDVEDAEGWELDGAGGKILQRLLWGSLSVYERSPAKNDCGKSKTPHDNLRATLSELYRIVGDGGNWLVCRRPGPSLALRACVVRNSSRWFGRRRGCRAACSW